MRNIVLTVAYDGTGLLGWQKCSDGPSVEEHLEGAIGQILQHPVALQAASRTDAGVHADGQVVNFFTEKNLSLEILLKGINALLPKTIRVMEIAERADDFHPTLSAQGKEYHYFLSTQRFQMPHERLYTWHHPYSIDLEKMVEAKEKFVGEMDFAAMMCRCDPMPKSTVRKLVSIDIACQDSANYCFKISGENFLYKMVRNIVGTLVYVGQGKIPLSSIEGILASKMRANGGVTAPAHGLRLKRVFYDF